MNLPRPVNVSAPLFTLLVAIAAGAPISAQEGSNPQSAGIAVSVRDAKDDTPIARFRILAGVPARSVSAEFTKRTGREVVNWQPHTVRVGAAGASLWPWGRAYEEMALRVEADGYQPQSSEWIFKKAGAARVEFLLVEDRGIDGIVHQPDGTPAANATVARALVQRDVSIEGGRIRGVDQPQPEKESDRWRRPHAVTTDKFGRFRITTETDPASAIVVVHESGVAELDNAQFQRDPEITLKPWGEIDGRVLWKDKPGAGELVGISVARDQYGYPGMVGSYLETRTDKEGRFVVDHVLPGRVQLSRWIRLPKTPQSEAASHLFDGLYVHVDVKSGEPTLAVIGGQGRTVVGRFTGRNTWDGVTIRLHPDAPHIGFPGDDESWKAFGAFRESDLGPLFFRDGLKPNADGTFKIPHLLPGRYQFFVSAPGVENYAASTVIVVEPETPGKAPPPLDMGDIAIKPEP